MLSEVHWTQLVWKIAPIAVQNTVPKGRKSKELTALLAAWALLFAAFLCLEKINAKT
jgi:hypothetical protein